VKRNPQLWLSSFIGIHSSEHRSSVWNLPTGPCPFYPLAQPAKDFLAIDALAAFQCLNAMKQLRFEFLARLWQSGQAALLIFLEPSQTGTDDLAGGLVEAAADFLLDEAFEFGCERDVHELVS